MTPKEQVLELDSSAYVRKERLFGSHIFMPTFRYGIFIGGASETNRGRFIASGETEDEAWQNALNELKEVR